MVWPGECFFHQAHVDELLSNTGDFCGTFGNSKISSQDVLIYRYSIQTHYKQKHPDIVVPSGLVVSEAEKKLVKSKNFKSKLAMSVVELNRLPDEQLALFPANEFWDAKKHAWKSTKAGVWAKSSSVKMKRDCLWTRSF